MKHGTVYTVDFSLEDLQQDTCISMQQISLLCY